MNPGLYNRLQSLQTPLVEREEKKEIKEEVKKEEVKQEEKKLNEVMEVEIPVVNEPATEIETKPEASDEYTEYTGDEDEIESGEESEEGEEDEEMEEDVPTLISNLEEEISVIQDILSKLKEKL